MPDEDARQPSELRLGQSELIEATAARNPFEDFRRRVGKHLQQELLGEVASLMLPSPSSVIIYF